MLDRIAIIGTGIAGNTAAYRLHRMGRHITVFDANDYIGGHTATVDVVSHGRHWAVDTGFIVFNDWTYPKFIGLLEELDVPWQPSNMSFSLRCERTGLEYNGTTLNSLFAQRRNMMRPSFIRMCLEILRFNRDARSRRLGADRSQTLESCLEEGGYSRHFVQHYIVPMGRAIWSASEEALLSFPVAFFIDFFERHGFLNVNDRPVWRAVKGGSREYVRRLVAGFRHRIRLNTPVVGVRREKNRVLIRTAGGDVEDFDAVVFACHSDQALRMLEHPTHAEREVLGAIRFAPNEVVLHTDARLLPRRPLARAAWNYHLLASAQERVAVTYDMNTLQSLDSHERFLVTLNRGGDIDPRKVLGNYEYDHPIYSPEAVAAQSRYDEINGHHRSFYCGAYWGHGFHEDGVVSAERMLRTFEAVRAGSESPQLEAAMANVR
ncbi:MAG: FAD-dependent oxidoreductase [Vicinamibacterales bacterium]